MLPGTLLSVEDVNDLCVPVKVGVSVYQGHASVVETRFVPLIA